jgi:hypothetical protein
MYGNIEPQSDTGLTWPSRSPPPSSGPSVPAHPRRGRGTERHPGPHPERHGPPGGDAGRAARRRVGLLHSPRGGGRLTPRLDPLLRSRVDPADRLKGLSSGGGGPGARSGEAPRTGGAAQRRGDGLVLECSPAACLLRRGRRARLYPGHRLDGDQAAPAGAAASGVRAGPVGARRGSAPRCLRPSQGAVVCQLRGRVGRAGGARRSPIPELENLGLGGCHARRGGAAMRGVPAFESALPPGRLSSDDPFLPRLGDADLHQLPHEVFELVGVGGLALASPASPPCP